MFDFDYGFDITEEYVYAIRSAARRQGAPPAAAKKAPARPAKPAAAPVSTKLRRGGRGTGEKTDFILSFPPGTSAAAILAARSSSRARAAWYWL